MSDDNNTEEELKLSSGRISKINAEKIVFKEELLDDEENITDPNAYIEYDPKPILLKLEQYSKEK